MKPIIFSPAWGRTALFMSLCMVVLLLADCKKDKNEEGLINPADANALSGVLIVPNADRQNGNIPNPSNGGNVPAVTNQITEYLSSNGSTVPLNFTYSNISGNLGGCYMQVVGANSYFNVPYTATSGNSGFLGLPIGIPTNVDSGQFCIQFAIYDLNHQVSNIVTACIEVLRLGTGAVQISLSWNTATDQDLHVIDPGGNHILWNNQSSPTGGELDRDDITGYGPENIFWLADAPDGKYEIWVDDFWSSSSPNTVYITINAGGESKSFTKTTQGGSETERIIMTKNGSDFDF